MIPCVNRLKTGDVLHYAIVSDGTILLREDYEKFKHLDHSIEKVVFIRKEGLRLHIVCASPEYLYADEVMKIVKK